MNRTRWGYELRVVGGNAEAARRSGLSPTRYIIIAMMLGGAMVNLYGMIEVTTIRALCAAAFRRAGYIGFLVAWLAGHAPLRIGDTNGPAHRLVAMSPDSGGRLSLNNIVIISSFFVCRHNDRM